MAKPHGLTVASIPAASASASVRSFTREMPSSSAISARSSSASSSPLPGGDDLAVGVEEHGGGQDAAAERGEHGRVGILRGGVGDPGLLDEGQGVVGPVGDGEAEEGELARPRAPGAPPRRPASR